MAVANNYDVRMVARRIDLASLSMKQTESAYWPVISARAGWTTERTSGYVGRTRSIAGIDNFFTLSVNASWEIDVFGRIRANTKSRKADVAVERANYDATIVSLCAQLAEAYLQLRVYQAQLDVAERLSVSQEEVLRVTEVRHECTLASVLDVSQAQTVCLSTKVTIPSLETSVAQSINAILVLTSSDNPALADLLRRRPDVVAAEMELAAYAAQIGVEKKDFLPTLRLNASIGTEAHRFGDLFSHDALTYIVVPTISWTIFSGGSRKYAVAEAEAQMMLGIENYNLTVAQAAAGLIMLWLLIVIRHDV